MIAVSLIICTLNRADSLRETLASIGAMAIPEDLSAELLVIDNGSTDATPEVVRAAPVRNMPVRHIVEPIRGQCHARNRGLAESAGRVILFTDDDVRVPRDWVVRMARPILDGRADALQGGVTFPPHIEDRLGTEPLKSVRSWFASTEELNPSKPERMVGANMAFSRKVLETIPAFDTDLGPGAFGFADETLFSAQLLAAGFRLDGQLDVAIEHHFDLSRLTRQSLLVLAERMGRSRAYVAWHWDQSNVPRPSLRRLRRRAELFWNVNVAHRSWRREPYPPVRWLQAVENLAFNNQYLIESQTPRRYTRHGMRKLGLS